MQIIRSALFNLLLGLLAATSAKAQHTHGHAPPPDIPTSWAQHLWFEEGPFIEPYDMGWGKGIQFPITTTERDTQAFFNQGWALLAADWSDEAVRSFRHALYKDPSCAMALWALSMASLSDEKKASTFLNEIPEKAKLTELEEAFIKPLQTALQSKPDWNALAESYRQLDHPEGQVAATWIYRCHPEAAQADVLQATIETALKRQPQHPLRAYVIAQPRWHSLVPEDIEGPLPERFAQAKRFVRLGKPAKALQCYSQAIPALAEYATLLRQVPSRWPRYVQALAETTRLLRNAGYLTEATTVLDHLRSLPRHPRAPFLEEAISHIDAHLPTQITKQDLGDLSWIQDLSFSGWASLPWELPTTTGEPVGTKDFLNRDVLLIFYLGKGCVHCMEQLQAFHPETEAYRKAGIEVVAISLDSVKGLKSTLALADPPFPFPLMSDEKLAIFRAYDAYDPFDRSPIHGTFFVSKSGMVKWADAGHEPFMKPGWLLEECQRLQKNDTSLPTIDN